jgi:hypothetical protein
MGEVEGCEILPAGQLRPRRPPVQPAPIAMRLPMRRNSRTTRPSTLPTGGRTVRSRKALATRTCSSVCPMIRGSNAVI